MNRGIPYAIGLCCVWPLLVYGGIELIKRFMAKRDWSNIRWNDIHLPWRKDD